MEHSLHCEFCDKINIAREFVYVRIFTQKCSKCNRVSLDRITKADEVTAIQIYICKRCHHTVVTNPSDICRKCDQTNLDGSIKDTTIMQIYACSLCHLDIVTNPSDICQKCSNITKLPNHTIMCYYCHMIPKSVSFSNNAVICGICNRAFHATIIKTDRTIASHPHQNKGPADCPICNG